MLHNEKKSFLKKKKFAGQQKEKKKKKCNLHNRTFISHKKNKGDCLEMKT